MLRRDLLKLALAAPLAPLLQLVPEVQAHTVDIDWVYATFRQAGLHCGGYSDACAFAGCRYRVDGGEWQEIHNMYQPQDSISLELPHGQWVSFAWPAESEKDVTIWGNGIGLGRQ